MNIVNTNAIDSITRRGLKNQIENLWVQYHSFSHLIQQVKNIELNANQYDLETRQYDVKQLINYYQGLENNPILIDLDTCFNGLQDLSDLVWSYLSNIFYCAEHKEMIYSKQCPKCVYLHPDVNMQHGEYYFNGEIEISESRYKLYPRDLIDRIMLDMIFCDDDKSDNGWYRFLQCGEKVQAHENDFKLIYYIPHYQGCWDVDCHLVSRSTDWESLSWFI